MEEIIFASGSVPVAVAARVYGERRILDSSRHRIWVAADRKSYSEWEARYEFRGNEL